MSRRITRDVSRPAPIRIYVDGDPVTAYPGDSIATALLAAGRLVASVDSSGRPRAPFCNMGVCFDCLVTVELSDPHRSERVRACLTPVTPGARIRLPPPEPSRT